MINLHKNKAKDKCFKTKKTKKIDEDDEVEIEDEEERESEKHTLVISKRKCVDEASGSKKRNPKPRSFGPFPSCNHYPASCPNIQNHHYLASPSKTPKVTTT